MRVSVIALYIPFHIPYSPFYIGLYLLMQVDDALIDKLSDLSMLKFSAEEKEEIKKDLEKMIGFIDKLKELDTTGVEPLIHMSEETNVLREDVIAPMISQKEALLNAPNSDGTYFKVPKVIKKPD